MLCANGSFTKWSVWANPLTAPKSRRHAARAGYGANFSADSTTGRWRGCTRVARSTHRRVEPWARSVEGFGISFLEAAFYGKPAAAFRSGGVVEAVIEGQTALLVAEDDLAGLALAIGRLLDDPELRIRMGEAGREYVKSLRWEDSARLLCEAAARLVPR